MANSRFEYVRAFERDDKLLLDCYIVVRVDGHKFHRFTQVHDFSKPNDTRGLKLMNFAARAVIKQFPDITLAYGNSDEYSFLLRRDYSSFDRRESKLISTIVSIFTGTYIFAWSTFFENVLKYPPSFDGRAVLYPNAETVKDYFSWRQSDCHINNLYNTTFWALILKTPVKRTKVPCDSIEPLVGRYDNKQAEERLRGSFSHDKNEILFHEYSVNYNSEPAIFRKGTILTRKEELHVDLITSSFWEEHQVL